MKLVPPKDSAMKSSNICVFSAICEEDAVWIPQYLKEIERLNLPFAILLDRCSEVTKYSLIRHPNCVAFHEQNEPEEFKENLKQQIYQKIPPGYKWAMALDVDEVWEKDAPAKLLNLPEADYLDALWVNLWGDDKHLRVDGYFAVKPRTKFYNMKLSWRFVDSTTNGPYAPGEQTRAQIDLVCVHHGLKTKELRQLHKERWDRIYTKAIGRQPYGFWDHALDETVVPEIIKNKYL